MTGEDRAAQCQTGWLGWSLLLVEDPKGRREVAAPVTGRLQEGGEAVRTEEEPKTPEADKQNAKGLYSSGHSEMKSTAADVPQYYV